MYLYNVTTLVSWPIHEKWVHWMKTKHIADVMGKGCFTEFRFARVLEMDETEGPTYTVQFMAPSRELYDTYLQLYAPDLRKEAAANFGDNCTSFRSLMQLVN